MFTDRGSGRSKLEIKLIDFGLSMKYGKSEGKFDMSVKMNDFVGTIYTMVRVDVEICNTERKRQDCTPIDICSSDNLIILLINTQRHRRLFERAALSEYYAFELVLYPCTTVIGIYSQGNSLCVKTGK